MYTPTLGFGFVVLYIVHVVCSINTELLLKYSKFTDQHQPTCEVINHLFSDKCFP